MIEKHDFNFANQKVSISYAGFLTSLIALGSPVIAPVIGYLLDRFKRNEDFIIVIGIFLALLFVFLPRSGNDMVMAMAIGLVAGGAPVCVFGLVPKYVSMEETGTGLGVLRFGENMGTLFGPFCLGLTYDLTGDYFYEFLVVAIFALISSICALILKIHILELNPLAVNLN
jgi:MFS family permease